MFHLRPITELKLVKLLGRLKPCKALPSDMLDGLTLKTIAPVLMPAILYIINLSLLSGQFDGMWKQQVILPHHKKGDKESMDNYRPVSNLVAMSLLVEMEVHDQFVQHFVDNNLFHPGHHGGVPHHDTTTALLTVHNYMLSAAEEKKLAGSVFIDQSSAFDLVDHEVLLLKLKEYNFSPLTLDWFASYLSGRSFMVQVESRRSTPMEIGPFGVPQGSILGSLLFVVSQNDLPAASPEDEPGQSVTYIDDNTEQASDKDPQVLQRKLQRRIDNTASWLADNRMVIAPQKTKLVISATSQLRAARHNNLQLSVQVGDQIIYPTSSEKLLGVVVSEDLTWGPHLWGEMWREEKNWVGVIPQLIQRVGILKYLARLSSRQKLRGFIPGMFTSKILYALPLVGSMWALGGYKEREPQKSAFTKSDLQKMQSLQRQAALLLQPTDTAHLSTKNLLDDTGWLSVHQLIAYTTLCLVIRIVQSRHPTSLSNNLVMAKPSRTSHNDLTVPRCGLNLSLEGFNNQACRLYNQLPDAIKLEKNREKLKKTLKEWRV